MPYHKSPAVIIRSLDFAEWDKLVTFFTRDFGKLKGVAKGAKKSRKRFGSGLEPLTYATVSFFEKERVQLVRLDRCEIIESFPLIHNDVLRIGYASYLGELINEIVAEREPSRELFELLITFLSLLNEKDFREEFIRIFELRLLSLAGYQPEFGMCVMCRKEVNGTLEHSFSQQKGGLVCLECFKGGPNSPRLSGGTIKMLQRAQTIELSKVKRLYFSPQARSESRKVLPHFIESRIEKRLKSLKFIEHLNVGNSAD
ncbi:MAG: DNA repair protein RecO [Thermodesulfobacteriota bacterium]|nr:DNA repair protein RecO [Thermodesulfobacteriota bacterium]